MYSFGRVGQAAGMPETSVGFAFAARTTDCADTMDKKAAPTSLRTRLPPSVAELLRRTERRVESRRTPTSDL